MRRAANADLPALDKFDARVAGLHPHVAAVVHDDTRLPELPWSRRIQIPIIAAAVYSVIRMLGPTLRYEVLGWQHAERVYAAKKQCIWAFWHRVILPIVWWYRNHGVVVMNTTAFDGQWTRKVIEWLGFGTAQGSSSRGGLRGLAVMARRIEEGKDCAFTIDGPRGPRYIAKPGPVMLARKTGAPIMVFHVGVDGDDYVTADVEAAHAKLRDAVAAMQASLRGGSAARNGLHEQTFLDRQIESFGQTSANSVAAYAEKRLMNAAVGDEIVRDAF